MFSLSPGLPGEVNCLNFLTICIKDIFFSDQFIKAGSNKKAVCSGLPEKNKRSKGCHENQGAGFISEIIPVSTV
jgi:hypothetical protein